MSVELPVALKPWAATLTPFAPDLALKLGEWLPRLSLAFGALRASRPVRADSPNGYDGISRRGSYERLLLSEWLLADAFPDEFTRRAAMGEHGFLQLGFQSPAGSKRSLVLLDCGPSQLGVPRIAQLAALIVLAQRAEATGAQLLWGVLQSDAEPRSEVTTHAVMAFLKERSPREPDEAMVARWRERLLEGASKSAAGDELWVLGGTRAVRLAEAGRAHAVEVREAIGARREVSLTVRRFEGNPQSLALPLPSAENCVRLIRDPFTAIVAPTTHSEPGAAPADAMVFADDRTRLFFRRADGALHGHFVPNSPAAPAGRPIVISATHARTAVAVGWHGSRVEVLCLEGGALVTRTFSKRGASTRPTATLQPTAASGVPKWNAEPGLRALRRVWVNDARRWWHVTTDGSGALVVWNDSGKLVAFRSAPAIALAASERHRSLRYVLHEQASRKLVVDTLDASYPHGDAGDEYPSDCAEPQAFFDDIDLVALQRDPRSWSVLEGKRLVELVAPEGTRVVGIARNQPHQPALIVAEEDGRTVSALSRVGAIRCFTTRGPIRRITTAYGLIACDSESELLVYSVSRKAILSRVHHGGGDRS